MLMSWRSFMPLALRSICAKVSNSLGSTSHFMSRPMLRSFGLELMRRSAEIWMNESGKLMQFATKFSFCQRMCVLSYQS